MEAILIWFMALFGGKPATGSRRPVKLSAQQQAEIRSLLASKKEVQAIRQVRKWSKASLSNAVSTVQGLKTSGRVPGA